MVRCTDCRCDAVVETVADTPVSYRVFCPSCWKATRYHVDRMEAIEEWGDMLDFQKI